MIGQDKLLHFWASFVLAFVSPGFSMAAGISKEVYDLLRGDVISFADLAADGLGILFASFISPFF